MSKRPSSAAESGASWLESAPHDLKELVHEATGDFVGAQANNLWVIKGTGEFIAGGRLSPGELWESGAVWKVIRRAARGGPTIGEFAERIFEEGQETPSETLFPDVRLAAPPVEEHECDVRARVEELTLRGDRLEFELERGRLEFECENLKSQLIAVRRDLLTVTRRAERLEAQNEGQLACISELTKVNRALQEAILGRDAGNLCMHGTHSGVVTEVEGDEIVVVYETDHGPIEQIYDRSQFRQSYVPDVGDDIEAHVFVARKPMDIAKRFEKADLEDKEDDFAAFREKGISGPIEI